MKNTFIMLFLTMIYSSPVSACDLNDASCSCEQGMTSPEEFGARTNYLWVDHPELFTPVPMRKYEGGWSILKKAPASVYLTELTFKKIKKEVTLPYISLVGHTYRYYFGDDVSAKLLSRGSGRDHLIQFGNHDLALKERLRARKGSGVNNEYSEVNGEFERFDFRKNGFENLPNTLIEQVTAEQYADAGLAVKVPDDLIIPPEELQFTLYHDKEAIDPSSVRVESDRNLSGGRQSHGQFELTEAQKIKIVAPTLLMNINHGALNPENISGHGEILDAGHTSFSVPMLSGQYRCTTCKGPTGARFDGVMISYLDYYFTPKNTRAASLTHSLSADQITLINHEILRRVTSTHAHFSKYSEEEVHLLRSLYREEFPVFDFGQGRERVNLLKQINYRIEQFYNKMDENFFGLKNPDSLHYTGFMALSTRFLIQLSALKVLLGDSWFETNVVPYYKILPDETKAVMPKLVAIYERDIRANLDAAKLKKLLFQEYRPSNVMMVEIKNKLSGIREFSQIIDKTQDLYQELKMPLTFTPEQWWEKIKPAWECLEKPDFKW